MASQLVHIQSSNKEDDEETCQEQIPSNQDLLDIAIRNSNFFKIKEDEESPSRFFEETKKEELLNPQTRSNPANSSQSSILSQFQYQSQLPEPRVQSAPQNIMSTTIQQLQVHKEKMPDCLCKNGEKAIYICCNEECSHFKSLKSRLSYERYYCEECMYAFHNHLPTHIIKKTFELGQKWVDLDSTLVHNENQFLKNMQEHIDLIQHYEEVAADKDHIQKKSFILPQLREHDQIKTEFYYETKDREDNVTDLNLKFKAIELLEIKEPIRKDFEKRINAIGRLAMIDGKKIGPIYKDVIEISGPESIEDLYKQPKNKELNRDMYIGLKFESMNELRSQDAEKIKNLEKLVQELLQRLSFVEGKILNK